MVKTINFSVYAGWNKTAFALGFSIDRKSISLDLAFAWLRLEW